MQVDILKEIIELDAKRKGLDFEVAQIKEKRAKLERQMLEEFMDEGVQSMKVDGRTCYLHRRVVVSAQDKQAACDFMKGKELEDYVKEGFDVRSIAAYVKEMEMAEEPLPDGFDDVFKRGEIFTIKTRAV